MTDAPRPNPDATIDFLKKWKKDGPWVLTAIKVDGKGIVTATFRPGQEDELRTWLARYGELRACGGRWCDA